MLTFILLNSLIFNGRGIYSAVLIRNNLEEIKSSVGKLELRMIRTWGGENEEDEHKFFETPNSVCVDNKNMVYICDQHDHVIKIFSAEGAYIKRIGRKGQGPADLYCPSSIALTPGGDIWTYEIGGRRAQCFSFKGKSKYIFKQKQTLNIFGITRDDELAVFNKYDTIKSGKLVCILDKKGNVLRRIGLFHDPVKHALYSEPLHFTMDSDDFIFALNTAAPVIRKYSQDDKMILAITFELPYEVPYKITLNRDKNEIQRIYTKADSKNSTIKLKKDYGGVIQEKDQMKHWIMHGIAIDERNRIFTLIEKRMKTEKEKKASLLIWSRNRISRQLVKYDVLDNMHIYRLIVCSPGGKVLAATDLSITCDSIYIHKDRLFLIDGGYYQRIVEYKMKFED